MLKSLQAITERAQERACATSRACLLVVLAFGFVGCKKADTEGAQGQMTTASEVRTQHAPVGCLDRLSSLVVDSVRTRPWAELSLEARLALCRGATSTAPVDCLLNVHDALTRVSEGAAPPPGLAHRPLRLLEFSARVCAGRAALPSSAPDCLVGRLKGGADLRNAALACRKPPPLAAASSLPSCVAKFAQGTPEASALHSHALAFTVAEARALCAGAKSPARPHACVEALAKSLASAPDSSPALVKSMAFTLCRGNDDPNAVSCFQEATGKALRLDATSSTDTLTTLQAARLCSAAE